MSEKATLLIIAGAGGLLWLASKRQPSAIPDPYPSQSTYLITGHRASVGALLNVKSGTNRKLNTPKTSKVLQADGSSRVVVNTIGRGSNVDNRIWQQGKKMERRERPHGNLGGYFYA
jgi:hypothetical protein